LPEVLISQRLDRPFLWLQGGESQQSGYLAGRDGLMSGLRQGGEVLVISGSTQASFTDDQSYYTATGRSILGDGARPETVDDITWETGEVISAFVGPHVGAPTEASLSQVLAGRPSIKEERHVASAMTS
jgi:hypothetical protein